jgi:uncharacterized membrane protein
MNDINENDKLMAAISYPVPIVAIVILLSESNKARPFQKFHAVQALAYWVAVLIVDVALCVLSFILGLITFGIAGVVGSLCLPVVAVGLWLVSFWPAVEAYQGKTTQLPVITDFIRKQAWV